MALAAAGLAKGGSTRFERTPTFNLIQRRQQVFHLPIPNELLLRLHAEDPVAEERNGSFIDHGGDQRRHLTPATPRQALVKNGAFRIAWRNQHGVVDAEG